VLNSSAPILRGIEQALPSIVPIVGAGLVGDITLTPSWQFCGDSVRQQTLVGAVLPREVGVHYRITHGCTPLDGVYHVITGIEGAVLRELDGQPVVGLIDDLYGNSDWQEERPIGFLTLGVNHGKRHAVPREEDYVNRLITGVLPDRSGVALFETDLELGTEIQFMLRDASTMVTSARRDALALMAELRDAGKAPLLGLYIDCAGRSAAMSNTLVEEAGEVQKVFAEAGVPLLGFYTGVEIAPFLEKNRGLDWTGVIVVLTDDGRVDG
jgi:small ligand-binding sensory domain FIST